MAASTRRPVANRPEIEEYLASRPPVELRLAAGIVRRVVIVGPIMVAIFGIFRGIDGAIAAALGALLVAAYYLLTGWILSATARVSLATYYAGALIGFFVRLILIGVSMVVLTRQFDVDRVALGVTVAATYVALLMWEAATFRRVSTDRASNPAAGRMGDKSGV